MSTPSLPYQFSFNGYLFGSGQAVQVLSIDGLEDAPPVRSQDTTRGYADGSFTGRDFLQGRRVTMHLQILADANGSMTTNLQTMKAALVPSQASLAELCIYLPNRSVQMLYARVRRRQIVVNPEYVYGRAEAIVEFFCPDPRIYDYNGGTMLSAVITPLGGQTRRTYPRTYPRTYSAAAAAGYSSSATLTNAGSWDTPLMVTVAGACTGLTITNAVTGQAIKFYTTGGLAVGSTDTVTINTDTKVVLLNGVPERAMLRSDTSWFNLQPGSTTINTATASGTPTVTLQWRNAYV